MATKWGHIKSALSFIAVAQLVNTAAVDNFTPSSCFLTTPNEMHLIEMNTSEYGMGQLLERATTDGVLDFQAWGMARWRLEFVRRW